MSLSARIRRNACNFVTMTPDELLAVDYRGCGYKYVAVKGGVIIAAHSFDSVGEGSFGSDEVVEEAIDVLGEYGLPWGFVLDLYNADYDLANQELDWAELKRAEGSEVWVGLFSCTEFCLPTKIVSI